MAGQPVATKATNKPGAKAKKAPRARAADRSNRPVDLDDPRLLPPALREKVDPAQVVASLEAQIKEIQAGRTVGIDGDAFFAEWGQELKRLGA